MSRSCKNSGKSAKSRKIHRNSQNTAKFARNVIKYMSIFHMQQLSRGRISLFCLRKIPKISPGAYIFEGLIFGGAYIQRGLSMEGNLHFKIDWASLIVGRKFTIFALFYFVVEGSCPLTSPRGAYIWRGDLMEVFLCYRIGGPIFGGAYTWRGLFSEFYGNLYPLNNTIGFPIICPLDSGLSNA